ncbi:MAG TPA: hypothetical protein VLA96_01205 [Terriglobales bacterium]|nr:hypothetical protein [Terriglobales bacterium]
MARSRRLAALLVVLTFCHLAAGQALKNGYNTGFPENGVFSGSSFDGYNAASFRTDLPSDEPMLALLTVAALVASGGVQPVIQEPPSSPSAENCRLREDGVYERVDPRSGWYYVFRFFHDGSAVPGGAHPDRELALKHVSIWRKAQRPARHQVDGCKLTITVEAWPQDVDDVYIGVIEGERLKLTKQHGTYREGQQYTFAPVDFAAFTKQQEAAQAAAEAAKAAAIQLRVGSATMDTGCKDVRFVAAASPVVLAAGSRTFAVELTGGFPNVSVSGGRICSTGGLSMRTCNKYAIVMGNPELYAQTTIVSCKDQRPFAAGRYTIRADTKTVALTVR